MSSAFLQTLRGDLKRSFLSWTFFAAVIGMIAIKIPGMWFDLQQYQGADVLYFFYYAPSQGIAIVYYLFCALPCASLFLVDWNHRFYRYAILRAGKHIYAASKIITCIITPIAAVFLSEILFVGALSTICPLVDPDSLCQSYNNLTRALTFGPILEQSFWAFFFCEVSLEALSGAFFSLCALAISTVIPNIFVVVAAPFLIRFYLQGFLNFFQLPEFLNINCIETGQFVFGSAETSLLYGILFFVTLLVLASFLFRRGFERKVSYG